MAQLFCCSLPCRLHVELRKVLSLCFTVVVKGTYPELFLCALHVNAVIHFGIIHARVSVPLRYISTEKIQV